MEAGEEPGPEVSILKLRGTQLLQDILALIQQAVGMDGLAAEHETRADVDIAPAYAAATAPPRFFSRGITISGGSSEIQRDIIAKHVLGLR